jgi:hypothetical protein
VNLALRSDRLNEAETRYLAVDDNGKSGTQNIQRTEALVYSRIRVLQCLDHLADRRSWYGHAIQAAGQVAQQRRYPDERHDALISSPAAPS